MACQNKIVIAFLSVSTENSTDQLIEQIERENADFRCVSVKLTQQDLQSFQSGETYDAVVLLHSISQGRNSITDVADAKYSKLLPKLKSIYGPDRVAVVVHSMTSFNSNTKMALMMVFKKTQPTTFQCSKCVIQCKNLAEMPPEDLTRLTEFIGKVTAHPLPIAENSTLTTTPSTDIIDTIGTGDNPQGIPVSGSANKEEKSMASSAPSFTDNSSMSHTEVGSSKNCSAIPIDNGSHDDPLRGGLHSYVPPTQSSTNQTSTTNTSSASSKVDDSPDISASHDKVIDTTYPIALFSVSTSNQLVDGLRRQLPGKTIMLIKDLQDLARNWHLFEAILVDLGSLQEAASYNTNKYKGALDIYKKCLKEMLVPQNLAVLMPAPANTHSAHKHADVIRMISDISKATEVSVFQYGSESCRPSLFDDATKKLLVNWLLDCYKRYHAAVLQEGPGFIENIKAQGAKLVTFLKKLGSW